MLRPPPLQTCTSTIALTRTSRRIFTENTHASLYTQHQSVTFNPFMSLSCTWCERGGGGLRYPNTCTHTHTTHTHNTHTHTLTHTLTRARARARTHTHTHTHTYPYTAPVRDVRPLHVSVRPSPRGERGSACARGAKVWGAAKALLCSALSFGRNCGAFEGKAGHV